MIRQVVLLLAISLNVSAGEKECLANILWAEAQGESLQGVVAVGHAAKNRAVAQKRTICAITGVKRKPPAIAYRSDFQAVAAHVLANKSTIGKADSWDRSLRPKTPGKIVARIGQHTFYEAAKQ